MAAAAVVVIVVVVAAAAAAVAVLRRHLVCYRQAQPESQDLATLLFSLTSFLRRSLIFT